MKNLMISTAVAVALAGTAAAETKNATRMSADTLRNDMIVSSQGQTSSSAIIPLIVLTVLVMVAAAASGGGSSMYGYGMMASDKKLKTDMKRVGTSDMGLPIYQFRYTGHDELFEGVLAQDVARLKPSAVTRHASGFLLVDYSQIDVTPRLVH